MLGLFFIMTFCSHLSSSTTRTYVSSSWTGSSAQIIQIFLFYQFPYIPLSKYQKRKIDGTTEKSTQKYKSLFYSKDRENNTSMLNINECRFFNVYQMTRIVEIDTDQVIQQLMDYNHRKCGHVHIKMRFEKSFR